jgi:phosphonate metabolism transcriptional regulator PhnF
MQQDLNPLFPQSELSKNIHENDTQPSYSSVIQIHMYRQVAYNHDRTPGLACYRQISSILEQKIDRGEFKPGERLPSEANLSKVFGVNRHTAREALKLLKNKGAVFGIQGKRNFVTDKWLQYRVSKKVRFSSSIMEAGMTPGTRILSCGLMPANAYLANKLAIMEGEEVLTIDLLRFANSTPLMMATTNLPAKRFTGLTDYLSSGSFSLYSLLKEHYNVDAQRTKSVFEVIMPDCHELRYLDVSPSVPLLLVRSTACDQHDTIIEYCTTRMRGDLASVTVDFS